MYTSEEVLRGVSDRHRSTGLPSCPVQEFPGPSSEPSLWYIKFPLGGLTTIKPQDDERIAGKNTYIYGNVRRYAANIWKNLCTNQVMETRWVEISHDKIRQGTRYPPYKPKEQGKADAGGKGKGVWMRRIEDIHKLKFDSLDKSQVLKIMQKENLLAFSTKNLKEKRSLLSFPTWARAGT